MYITELMTRGEIISYIVIEMIMEMEDYNRVMIMTMIKGIVMIIMTRRKRRKLEEGEKEEEEDCGKGRKGRKITKEMTMIMKRL